MAIQIIREVSADVVKRGATRAVYAKQNDKNSRFLNVRIQEEGKDIAVAPSETVMLNVERPDHQEGILYGTVNEDGTVRVPLTSWMLELEGTLTCDISIVAEGEDSAKLTTMQFNIYVEEAVITDESLIDSEEYSVIVDLLKRTTAAEASAVNAEASATEAAKQAQTLKDACEDSAAKAYKAAEDATAVRNEVQAGGFIESLREINLGDKFRVWVGDTKKYETLTEEQKRATNTLFLVTDDDLTAVIESLCSKVDAMFNGMSTVLYEGHAKIYRYSFHNSNIIRLPGASQYKALAFLISFEDTTCNDLVYVSLKGDVGNFYYEFHTNAESDAYVYGCGGTVNVLEATSSEPYRLDFSDTSAGMRDKNAEPVVTTTHYYVDKIIGIG